MPELTEERYSIDDSETWNYWVDCAQQQFVPVRQFRQGIVTYLAEAQRKAETLNFVSQPNLGKKIAEQVLCEPISSSHGFGRVSDPERWSR
jgi:hypothetical protein